MNSSLDNRWTCTFEYAATRSQYGKVLASDTMVDIYMAKTIIYMHIWLSGVVAICIKQVFPYVFIKIFLIISLVPLIETREPE